ncbi:TIGR02569 family protein [Nakamurella leprariae]|uniref:TIGR02569 family protein n=1 Tax=Nakamurella leprariae TaxID=2803911 RepID=A0A938Y9R4_9ACTN|nr:TIGR02569 family protein [Nakamurella leprariae]MBM9465784.1 TIGR02569 family protein [Nakamurella leprariae]
MSAPPGHVLAAFGSPTDAGAWSDGPGVAGWRCGDLVVVPVRTGSAVQAAWTSGVLDQLDVPGLRLARPVRASDGRWVIAGWRAQRVVTGDPEPRFDDLIAVSLSLHDALSRLPEPRFLRDRTGAVGLADHLTWDAVEPGGVIGAGHGARLFQRLAAARRPLDLPLQVVHVELTGDVLFAGAAPPAVVGLTPLWRPAPWASALVVVDGIAHGGAGLELAERWSGRFPDWPELLRRAMLFRLAQTLLEPPADGPARLVELLAAAELLDPVLLVRSADHRD